MGGVFAEWGFDTGADEHVEVCKGDPFDRFDFFAIECESVVFAGAVGEVDGDELFVGGVGADEFQIFWF